jgi:mannobiose 2-epimerase
MAAKTPAGAGPVEPGFPLGSKTGLWLTLVGLVIVVLILTQLDRREDMIREHIDGEWFRQNLVRDNLAHWLAAAPTDSGFLRSELDRQWRPDAQQVGTLVSQSRLLFVLAAGHDVTAEEGYLETVRKGADFLIEEFHDDEHGGWFWSVSPEGEPQDTYKDAYGHAFVIFGLAHAGRVTGQKRFTQAALETWETMKAHLVDSHGGIKRRTSRDWKRRRGRNSQNPMMHLFEALLALHQATESRAVFDDATKLAEFIFGRLYQADPPNRRAGGGYLPEMYDDEWKPLAGRGAYVDLGHQFEWAFLLSQAVRQGFPQRYLDIGRRLLEFGMKHAYDGENGGIFSASDYAGRVRGKGKGWWQQCEHLRALMRYAADHGREDLWEAFDKSLAFVQGNFLDREYGGWYGSYHPNRARSPQQQRKGSTWKVGYHGTGMYLEALRLRESAD